MHHGDFSKANSALIGADRACSHRVGRAVRTCKTSGKQSIECMSGIGSSLTTVHRIHLALLSAVKNIAADIVHDSKSMKGPGSNS